MRIKNSTGEINGALFDMDGLLVNSENLYWQANIQASHEAKLKTPDDMYLKLVGSTNNDMQNFYDKYFETNEQRNHFIRRTDELVWQWTNEGKLKLRPGVQEALDFLQKRGILMAIVTSNTEAVVEHNLWMTGIRNYFQFHLNLDDTKTNSVRPKPAPDIYLLAAKKLGIPKANLLAFEDSSPGLQSAVNAGIRCIMVPDLIPATKTDQKIATSVCKDFFEVLKQFQ